ncbi:MAG: DUF2851 family protein [Maribacter sp.]|nr:DUF2851 family protein [Maribacter sp.]
MREDLLQFIWKYKKLQLEQMVTTNNEALVVLDVGLHNLQAGPDFFNAKINIDGQLWAGNVEIHKNASDWYAHHHEGDSNYENVILHVVWKDDMTIYRKDNTSIPTLELSHYIPDDLLRNYQNLFDTKNTRFINCENEISGIDKFILNNWLERLYIERLEHKSKLINELLKATKNDWESVLYILLLKNFGLKINGDSFFSLAQALDFNIIRKLQKNQVQLESILFGLTGLLNDESVIDPYHATLKNEYHYIKHKFDLDELAVLVPEFFKLRPPNFPTIRLSQFANLYNENHNLFYKVVKANTMAEFYKIFEVSASAYWDDHFTFGKRSTKSTKKLTKKFIDLLIINTILPIKFSYAKHLGKDLNESLLTLIGSLKKEDNTILKKFTSLGIRIITAGESQAVLQLYNAYCSKNKCLQCAIGGSLLNGNI